MKMLTKSFRIKKSRVMRLAGIEFMYWATVSAYYPFIVIFLSSKGLDNTEIGTILAINSFVSVFALPFWGYMSDREQSVNKIFILCLTTVMIMWLSIPFFQSLFLIGLAFALITWFESPLPSLTDNWVILGIKGGKGLKFGNIRLVGSISYAVMVYVNSVVIEYYGISAAHYSFAVMALLSISILRNFGNDKPVKATGRNKNFNLKGLICSYRYVTLLIFATVIFIPYRSAYIYLPNLITALGGNQEFFGLTVSLLSLSEIPFHFCSGYLIKRTKPVYLILVSSVFFILRQFLCTIVTKPLHVMLISMLHGPSYALFLSGVLYYIDSLASPENRFTAQTLGGAFIGISGIIGSYGGGWLIDHFGLMSLYKIGTFMSVVISILFIISLLIDKYSLKQDLITGI